jgi:hypothetical protein
LIALKFPVYALSIANMKGGWRWTVVLFLLAAHVVAAVAGVRMYRASKGEFGMGGANSSPATGYGNLPSSLERAIVRPDPCDRSRLRFVRAEGGVPRRRCKDYF